MCLYRLGLVPRQEVPFPFNVQEFLLDYLYSQAFIKSVDLKQKQETSQKSNKKYLQFIIFPSAVLFVQKKGEFIFQAFASTAHEFISAVSKVDRNSSTE